MKMRISVSGDCSELPQLISKENLEEKYGGLLPNKVEDFFPPDLIN